MHELSLCQGILDAIEAEAHKQNFRRVRSVQLEIGALAGVDCDALNFAWEVASPGSLADGSVLDIVPIPGSAWCFACQDTVSVQQYYDPCPRCRGHKLRVSGGEQLKIKQLEVE